MALSESVDAAKIEDTMFVQISAEEPIRSEDPRLMQIFAEQEMMAASGFSKGMALTDQERSNDVAPQVHAEML